jgi:hypothetical protein
MKIVDQNERHFVFLILFLILNWFFMVDKTTAQQENKINWQTPAEKTDYLTTPRYTETLDYLRKLETASSSIKLTSFGKTGEGRDLILIIAAKDKAFTPEAARKQKKAVVLVQACIHAGESDGKDAGLALLRDIAITKSRENLLDQVVLLFEPIYNADGHEKFGRYNRINQNGPEEMGFRGNGRNINLNRDYMKADELETRGWLKLWNEWEPDLFIDCHVTDGADYRYNLTYKIEQHEVIAAPVREWLFNAIENRAVPNTQNLGNLLAPYLEFRDNRDLKKGIDEFLYTPRYATGYTTLRNRPAILIETHMLKPYKNRVLATYDFLRMTIEEVNRDPTSLFDANQKADAEMLTRFQTYDANAKFPLSLELTDKSTTFLLKAVESKTETSEVSGDTRVVFDNSKPLDITVPFYNQTKIAASVAPPLAYVMPPQWIEAIERLEMHGIKFERLKQAKTFDVEIYSLKQPKWAPVSFENRVMIRDFTIEKTIEKREFPANSVLVKLNQPAAQVAIHLLEPAAPDSLVKWGFFNSIFEQKEYGEAYVVEKMAREMLAKNANLRREFEEKLKNDQEFAANPRARLNFFYQRSPYYLDQKVGLYPIGRIIR